MPSRHGRLRRSSTLPSWVSSSASGTTGGRKMYLRRFSSRSFAPARTRPPAPAPGAARTRAAPARRFRARRGRSGGRRPTELSAGRGASGPTCLRRASAGRLANRQAAEDAEGEVRGVLRPRVVVSRDLLRAVDTESMAAIVAHERAHSRRRDPLRRLLASLLLAFHLPPVATRRPAGAGPRGSRGRRSRRRRRRSERREIRGENILALVAAR